LRIDISSSNFPAYHLHSNIAGPWALQDKAITAKQAIHIGGVHASWIDIPIANYEYDKKIAYAGGADHERS